MTLTPSSGDAPGLIGWTEGWVRSRRGAGHIRRGQPCQDATLLRRLQLSDGEPLLLLALADGHGGLGYSHSDVGSTLACQVASDVVAASLATLPAGAAARGGTLLPLRRWLAETLPVKLHQRWLAAVERHWRTLADAEPNANDGGEGDPAGRDARFSPIPYGTTLGVLLLAPRWWAVAGLGDWDLVRVRPDGAGELMSQETALVGAGEATEIGRAHV